MTTKAAKQSNFILDGALQWQNVPSVLIKVGVSELPVLASVRNLVLSDGLKFFGLEEADFLKQGLTRADKKYVCKHWVE